MAGDCAFLEWAHVFGHRYGTPRAPVEDMLADGQDILFDIDWQGAQQLYQQAGGDVVRVVILPPSLRELVRRLRSRATDSDAVFAARMEPAAPALGHCDGLDCDIINTDTDH